MPAVHAVDRFVARLGARRLVAGRPGFGWMLVEFFPVMIWSRITGAISLESSFYLVGFLTVLGADAADRAWLIVLYGVANVVQMLIIRHRYRHGPGDAVDAKRHCIRDAWWGRGLWTMGLLWPLVGSWLGLEAPWLLGGFLIGAFFGQLFFFTSVSAWATWTRDLLPAPLRGQFFAWRLCVGFILYGLVTLAISQLWPSEAVTPQLWWYSLLFAAVSIPCLLSTLAMAACPAQHGDPLPPAPASRPSAAFWRFSCWHILHAMAMACTLLYVPDLIAAAGVGTADYAGWESVIRGPVSIASFVLGGLLLPRLHARGLLLIMSLCLIAAFGMYLQLRPDNAVWLLPLALAAEAAGYSLAALSFIIRLYELIPAGDPRLPSLFIAVGAAASAATALLIPPLLALLPTETAHPAAWYLVAAGLGLRLLSLPLLADGTRLDDDPPTPITGNTPGAPVTAG